MGKHDSDEGMSFFLGGAEGVKKGAFWIKDKLKVLAIVALIPIVGAGVYFGCKAVVNYKSKKPKTSVPVVASNDDSETKKEYLGGYEVIRKS